MMHANRSNPSHWGLFIVAIAGACAAPQQAAAPPKTPKTVTTVTVTREPVAAVEPAGKPRSDLIPRTVLFGNPERTDAQISPDGKYISWLAPSNGVLNVWVAPAAALDRAKPVTADTTRPVRLYFWTFDGPHLLYMQDKGGDENHHVYRSHVETGEVVDLTPIDGVKAQVYGLSPTKPKQVIVALNERDPKAFDLYSVELATGKRELLAHNDQNLVEFELDNDLKVRYGQRMNADGTLSMLGYDASNKSWQDYDLIPAADSLTTRILGFDKQNKSYYATDSRGRDTGALLKVDANTKAAKLIYEDRRVDLADTLVHPTQRTLQAVVVTYDRPAWVALDPSVKADFEGIAKLGDGTGFGKVVSRTLDDKTWIVALSSDRAAPSYYRWDRKTKAGTFLFSARPGLEGQPLVKMQSVVIKARDGLSLVSYLSLPLAADPDQNGAPDAPVPLVLLVHGGPWGRDEWGYNPLHQLLANRGYGVLSVNFRGSVGFGKEFVNRGDKQWGKQMHDDLLDAVDWAVAQRIADKDKIGIMGGSYGGYATLVGLTMTPDRFACGVDIVGPSNVVTLLETIPPYWAPMLALFKNRVGDHTTEEGKRALLEISPLSHAAKIQRPLLIAQGQNDPRVKRSESDQIVAAMQAKGIPVGYVVFPDEGHGFARPENSVAFYAVTESFLSVHLGGDFEPVAPQELTASSLQVAAGRDTLPALPERAAGDKL